MKCKYCVWMLLTVGILTACGPDRRVAWAEELMARKETDSALAVMRSIVEPSRSLSDRDYALYALLRSEAAHRQGQLTAATDTLLVPAIEYFSRSGDSLYAERALYCKGHLDRRLYRYKDAMQSFLRALLFLEGSGNDEQIYRVNTWLGVVCIHQEEPEGKIRYSKAALQAALRMGNNFYKNLALCDISTGYYFKRQQDSALHYALAAYDAALADSLPGQLPYIYSNLGSVYQETGEYGKALHCLDRAISGRPASDSLPIYALYSHKVDVFGKMGRYDSAYHYFRRAMRSPRLATRADACSYMAGVYRRMGRPAEAYDLLLQYTEIADTVRRQQNTAEAIALQELYRHEQLAVENLHWRTEAAEKKNHLHLLINLLLLLLWVASAICLLYRRNRRQLRMKQQELEGKQQELEGKQQELEGKQQELSQQREVSSERHRRMVELEQKQALLKEAFFRRLNQGVVQEIEQGGNIILSDEDWEAIMQNADLIFDGYTRRLRQAYPTLNQHDLRYCCMVKMQLSQSEMSQIMHLEKDSVKKRLKRIRLEKMGAESGVTLEELLKRF